MQSQCIHELVNLYRQTADMYTAMITIKCHTKIFIIQWVTTSTVSLAHCQEWTMPALHINSTFLKLKPTRISCSPSIVTKSGDKSVVGRWRVMLIWESTEVVVVTSFFSPPVDMLARLVCLLALPLWLKIYEFRQSYVIKIRHLNLRGLFWPFFLFLNNDIAWKMDIKVLPGSKVLSLCLHSFVWSKIAHARLDIVQ